MIRVRTVHAENLSDFDKEVVDKIKEIEEAGGIVTDIKFSATCEDVGRDLFLTAMIIFNASKI